MICLHIALSIIRIKRTLNITNENILPIVWIKIFPICHQPRVTVVQQGTEVNTIIPISCKVFDPTVWQNGLKLIKYELVSKVHIFYCFIVLKNA